MTNPLAPSSLLTPLISSAAMRAIVDDRARLQRMLDFEVALARAQAAIGVIPALATDAIAAAASAERYDIKALGVLLNRLGDREGAVSALERAEALDPGGSVMDGTTRALLVALRRGAAGGRRR